MNYIEQLRSLKTLTYREIIRFFRIWQQALIPSVITTMLYFVIFGTFIGSRIGLMGGFEYMQFMAPGLIMLAVITNSYSNVVSSFYGNKFSRSLEELLVSPMPTYLILIGFVAGGVARGIIVGMLVLITSLFFTEIVVFLLQKELKLLFLYSKLLLFREKRVTHLFQSLGELLHYILLPLH